MKASASEWLLRVALALAFLFPPIDAIFDPYTWIGYFPSFISIVPVSPLILLHLFGVLEVIIALWILSGWKIRIPALLAAVLLILIVAFNTPQFSILFRDLSIALAALALAFFPRQNTVQ